MAFPEPYRRFLPDRIMDDIGHNMLQDVMDEFRPDKIFKDTFGEFAAELNELRPSKLLHYAIFGK